MNAMQIQTHDIRDVWFMQYWIMVVQILIMMRLIF